MLVLRRNGKELERFKDTRPHDAANALTRASKEGGTVTLIVEPDELWKGFEYTVDDDGVPRDTSWSATYISEEEASKAIQTQRKLALSQAKDKREGAERYLFLYRKVKS